MEISLNKFRHCKLQRCQTLRSETQIAAETVRPSNRWPLKNIANFSRNLFTDQIDQTRSLLHSERLRKFWLLEIARVYHARHVKCHFVSDKQTRSWHELSKVTNQRVYQELVYRNEVFKTMLTGSPVVPSFSTRPRSSLARFFNRPHWQRAWNRLGSCLLDFTHQISVNIFLFFHQLDSRHDICFLGISCFFKRIDIVILVICDNANLTNTSLTFKAEISRYLSLVELLWAEGLSL